MIIFTHLFILNDFLNPLSSLDLTPQDASISILNAIKRIEFPKTKFESLYQEGNRFGYWLSCIKKALGVQEHKYEGISLKNSSNVGSEG